MKKIIVLLSMVLLISCSSIRNFFTKTDELVVKGAKEYQVFVDKADLVFTYVDMIDSHIYNPIVSIYYKDGVFTEAFNNLSDTEQSKLLQANDIYIKVKEEVSRLYVDYNKIKKTAEKGFYDYYDIRNKTLHITGILEDIPQIIVNLSGFVK